MPWRSEAASFGIHAAHRLPAVLIGADWVEVCVEVVIVPTKLEHVQKCPTEGETGLQLG